MNEESKERGGGEERRNRGKERKQGEERTRKETRGERMNIWTKRGKEGKKE